MTTVQTGNSRLIVPFIPSKARIPPPAAKGSRCFRCFYRKLSAKTRVCAAEILDSGGAANKRTAG
jgi:hypothetical protein